MPLTLWRASSAAAGVAAAATAAATVAAALATAATAASAMTAAAVVSAAAVSVAAANVCAPHLVGEQSCRYTSGPNDFSFVYLFVYLNACILHCLCMREVPIHRKSSR